MSSVESNLLHDTWHDVLTKLEVCVKLMRRKKGSENCVITVCFSDGDSLDTFTVPRGEWMHGVAGALSRFCSKGSALPAITEGTTRKEDDTHSGRVTGRYLVEPLSQPVSQNRSVEDARSASIGPDYLEYIEKMSMAEMKRFLSAVRDRLRLRAFEWPCDAREKFSRESKDPVPGAPGRSNSRKSSLILMISICVEVDVVWRRAILAEIQCRLNTKTTGKRSPECLTGKTECVPSSCQPNNLRVVDVDEGFAEPTLVTSATIERLKPMREILPKKDELLNSVRMLPLDELRVSTREENWPDLCQLLAKVQHPKGNCTWFRQLVPGDGNCLFYAMMIASGTRQLAMSNIRTVSGLRKLLSGRLKELSEAGSTGSSFRRDWLISCLHDMEVGTESNLREQCESVKQLAFMSGNIEDIEHLLTPLRAYVSKWAEMIGDCHWGGLLTAEMSILASITGAAIEVLGTGAPSRESDDHMIEVCDLREGGKVNTFQRRYLFLPVKACVPSPDEDCRLFSFAESSSRLWIGHYPVVRVILDGRHYEPCTSRMSFPISPNIYNDSSPILNGWFNISDTLVEPYSTLTTSEEERVANLEQMFDEMPHPSEMRTEHGGDIRSFIDYTIYERGPYCLSVSQLRRLHASNKGLGRSEDVMLCEDLVNCYMSMLEVRSNSISTFCNTRSLKPPPNTRYFESSIFETAYRGMKGPASKRKKANLAEYDQLVFPVLKQGHWVLGLILVKQRVICVYDPLGARREDIYRVLLSWSLKKLPFSYEKDWTFHHVRESRNCIQRGSVDCGVYVCKAAESFGLGIPLRMSQLDVSYVRRRMISEFAHQELTTIHWPRI